MKVNNKYWRNTVSYDIVVIIMNKRQIAALVITFLLFATILILVTSLTSWSYVFVKNIFAEGLDSIFRNLGLYNYKLEIGQINVFPLGQFTVNNISFTINGQKIGNAGKISIQYSVRKLLAGNFQNTLVALHADSIEIDGDVLLELINQKQRETQEVRIDPVKLDFINMLPKFEAAITNLKIIVKSKNNSQLFIPVLKISNNDSELQSELYAVVNYIHESNSDKTAIQKISIPMKLTLAAQSNKLSGVLSLSVNGGSFSLSKIDITFIYNIEKFIASINGLPGVSLCTLQYDFNAASVSGKVNLNNFKPVSILTVPKSIKQYLPTAVNGSLEFVSDFSQNGTSGIIDLTGSLPFGLKSSSMQFVLEGSGNFEHFTVSRAELFDSNIKAAFSGVIDFITLQYEGTINAILSEQEKNDIDVSIYVSGDTNKLFLYAPEIKTDRGTLYNITADALLKQGSTIDFYINCGKTETADNMLTIQGSAQFKSFDILFISIDAYNFSVAPVTILIDRFVGTSISSLSSNIAITTKVTFQKSKDTISAQSYNTILTWKDKAEEFLVFNFLYQKNNLTINNIVFNSRDIFLTGRIDADINNLHDISIFSNITVNSVSYALEGDIYNNAVFITINNNFRIKLVQDGNYIFCSYELKDFPVNLKNEMYYISSKGNAFFNDIDNWKLQFDFLDMNNKLVKISTAGEIEANGCMFPRVLVIQSENPLSGTVRCKWSSENIVNTFSIISNFSSDKNENFTIQVQNYENSLNGTIKIEKLLLERLGLPANLGRISSTILVDGTINEPLINANIIINQKETIKTSPFLTAACEYDNGYITFSNIQFYTGSLSITDAELKFNVATMKSSATGNVSFLLEGTEKNSIATLHFNAAGENMLKSNNTQSSKTGTTGLSYTVIGMFDTIVINEGNFVNWPFAIKLNNDDFVMSIGENEEAYFAILNRNKIVLKLARSLPVSCSLEGTLDDNQLHAVADDVQIDLPYLFDFLALPAIKVESGTASGNLSFTGPIADPDISGILVPKNFKIMLPDYSEELIGPIVEPLYVNEKTMELYQTSVSVGTGKVVLRFTSNIEAWVPNSISISVAGLADYPIPVKTIFSGLQVHGFITPTLSIQINETETLINGQITYNEGDVIITPDVFSSGSSSSSSTSSLIVQLQFVFGTRVSVYFPYKQFPVIQGQIAPRSVLQVVYDGFTEDYTIKGVINLRNGNVLYIKRNFYLKKASITFNESNRKFSPQITLEAESRTVYNQDKILVKLSTQNSPLDNLLFKLESIPPLSELEIAKALGHDLFQIQNGSLSVGQMLVENSDLIPQLDLTGQIEAQIIALTGLDVFYFQSQLLQKVLVDISGLSATSGTLGEYLDNTAIVGGKYLTDQLYVQGTLQVVQDPFSNLANLSLVTTFSLEWVNPYFTLWWQIQPQNPNTLFITDQSLGIMWRIEIK